MKSFVVVTTASLVLVGLAACAHDPSAEPAASPSTSNAVAPSAPSAAVAPTSNEATTAAAPPTSAAAPLAVGSPPPDVTATASDGTPIHLAALKGKPVVVYFYPKDETPGCTKEACSFRDAWDKLSKTGVVLIGVSADSDDSHKAFAAHHKLPFLLVSDKTGSIAASFGVPVHEGFTSRQSFVIGADGNVKKIYRKVDVTVHSSEIAADLAP
jgi:thioredoxin-dependent peroxiredoxin